MKRIIAIAMLCVLCTTVGVYAQNKYGVVKMLTNVAQVNNPIIKDGEVQHYYDGANGEYPTLNYKGRTYLPVRAIAEQNGYNKVLMWNGVTGEIHLEDYTPPEDMYVRTAQVCYVDNTGFAFYNNENYYYCEVNSGADQLQRLKKGDNILVMGKNNLYYPNSFHIGLYPYGTGIGGKTSILR